MSDLIDFPSISHYKENNRLEAKRALGGLPKSIWETYSAFANSLGGVILLGIEEHRDKSLHAIDLPSPERLVEEFWTLIDNPRFVSANILSPQDVTIENISGKRIVVITVPRAPQYLKPIYVDGNPLAGTYVRNGEGDYRCQPSQVREMLQEAISHTPDMRVLESLDSTAFDEESVRNFRELLLQKNHHHPWNKVHQEDFLYKIGALARSPDGAIHPTEAGLLMFGRYPAIKGEFPAFSLEYQEYAAESELLQGHYQSGDETGLKNIFSWVTAVLPALFAGITLPTERDPALDYTFTPVHKALQEGLCGALLHHDYYQHEPLLFYKHGDLVTFPGTPDANGYCNKALLRMFNLVGLAPGIVSDLPKIFGEWRLEGWEFPRPVMQDNPQRFSISTAIRAISRKPFHARNNLKKSQAKELIIAKLTSDITLEISDLVFVVGLSGRQTRQILKEMEDEGTVTSSYGFLTKYYKLKA